MESGSVAEVGSGDIVFLLESGGLDSYWRPRERRVSENVEAATLNPLDEVLILVCRSDWMVHRRQGSRLGLQLRDFQLRIISNICLVRQLDCVGSAFEKHSLRLVISDLGDASWSRW